MGRGGNRVFLLALVLFLSLHTQAWAGKKANATPFLCHALHLELCSSVHMRASVDVELIPDFAAHGAHAFSPI